MTNSWFPAANEPGIVGRFEYFDILDIAESKRLDEKVEKRIIVLREKVAASTDNTVRKVKPENQAEFIKRFPQAWQDFNGEEVTVPGTPLADMGYGEDEVLRLKLSGIYVVEQLAAISDAIAEGLGFGYKKKREDAKAFLAKGTMAPPPPPPPATSDASRFMKRDDESVAEFAVRMAAMAEAETAPPDNVEPIRKGGRPKGSKNKPKDGAAVAA